MAYSVPELMLVGAAQNLVLNCSPAEEKLLCSAGTAPGDFDPVQFIDYNCEPTW